MSRTLGLIGLCCFASLAQAADNGIYLGAGIAQSDYGLESPGSAQPFDDETGGYKIIAGWRPLDSFGVEASYLDHGSATVPSGIVCTQFITLPCPDRVSLKAKSATVFAVGYLDLPFVDLFAKAGFNSWSFDGSSTAAFPNFRINEDGTELAWGVGVQARLRSLGARLEYERFNIVDNESLDTISLSLTWTFL
jgi:hypothetical protein